MDDLRSAPASKRWFLVALAAVVLGLVGFAAATMVFRGPQPPLPPQPDSAALTADLERLASDALARIEAYQPLPSTTAPAPEPEVASVEDASSRAVDGRGLPSWQRPIDAGCAQPVTVIPPAADLAAVVAAAEPGTCFVLQPGDYRFHSVVPKDGMSFLGTARDQVRVVGSASTENAFHGTAAGVTIGRMTLTGFRGTAGQKPQEQAAIRGTSAVWLSDRGQMARDWLIEDVEVSGGYASGIFLGDHFTVRGSFIRDNDVTGIGGSEVVGGLIEGNVITGNGNGALQGYQANGGGIKITESGTPQEPVVVYGNEIHSNADIGVWCDIACNGFEVINNHIHSQRSYAVMIELSSNAVIRGNLIVDANTWTDFGRDFNAGAIGAGESSDILIEDNYIDGAEAGVVIRQTRRPVLPQESFLYDYPGVTFTSGRVHVRRNVMVRTKAVGVSTGVTGRGLIADPASIRFEANTYGDPGSMTFWWDGGARYSFADWQKSGRDVGAQAAVPARPQWQRAGS